MYVIINTKCWKKTNKQKQKKLKTTTLPALSAHSLDLLALALLVCGPPSTLSPGEGGSQGESGPGDLPLDPHLLSQCRAGWGVRFIYVPLAHSSTYASPHPGPSMFLCLCSFPSTSQDFSSPLPLTTGSGMEGPPPLESAGCLHGTLTSPQPVGPFVTPHQGGLTLPGTGR